ncbi:MAG: pyruvate ferredoxin oxidoreductase [Thermotogae bacterium]|nr:MAG: pyruvate ferredoxin oxidoreductase [Thermotogota bacterium]
MRLEIPIPQAVRIAGLGGQGNILAARILAEALMKQGYWVAQSQSFGAQVRGGTSYADVLYCNRPIDYPVAELFDVLYCMHGSVVSIFLQRLAKNGVLLIDSDQVTRVPRTVNHITKKIVSVPMTKIAHEKVGDARYANMVGLGALVKSTGIVRKEFLLEAIEKNIPGQYVEANKKAVEEGYKAVEKTYRLRREERYGFLGRGFE